jgi:hypothetical protein
VVVRRLVVARAGGTQPLGLSSSSNELQIFELFNKADADKSGHVDREELIAVR